MFFICDYIKNLFTTNDKINIKEEETVDTIYNQSLLNLPNDRCLLCNNKFKKNRYNIFIKCDNCNKIWATCYNCPKLLENIKVCSVITPKKAIHYNNDKSIYEKNLNNYKNKILPKTIKHLK